MLEPMHADRVADRFPLPFPMTTEQVVLAFDYGARRIGVAIGNTVTRRARPLSVIEAEDNAARWRAIAQLIGEWSPARLVVGVPRHPDGAPHEMTARCEKFARQLAGRYGLPVASVDERYSSAVVERNEELDAHAAAVILQHWFDESGA